jgi:hypothetical protein
MKKFFATMILVVVAMAPAFAATSVASLNGTYNFQVNGVTNQYGYNSCSGSTCTWHIVTGNCPTGQSCQNQAFPKASVGTMSFNGKGTATFISIAQYNNGTGGPVAGTTCTYTVSGFTGDMTKCATKGVSLNMGTVVFSLGGFNTANVATSVLIFSTETGSTNLNFGVANLQ